MGATSFETTAIARTPEIAFYDAVQQAKFDYGHDGYTGTIAEKNSFKFFETPAEFVGRPYDYANHLMRTDDTLEKWGPAGCILIRSDVAQKNPRFEEFVSKIQVNSPRLEGQKKWETCYTVYTFCEERGLIERESYKYKDEATKAARAFASRGETANVLLRKTLVSHDSPVVFTASPVFAKRPLKETINEYLFFGYASS